MPDLEKDKYDEIINHASKWPKHPEAVKIKAAAFCCIAKLMIDEGDKASAVEQLKLAIESDNGYNKARK